MSAADADLVLLAALDQDLRRDVPGVGAWCTSPEAFRRETFDDPQFDPSTYLIAVHEESGGYAGLVRVWMRPSGPRLGLIGNALFAAFGARRVGWRRRARPAP